VPRVRRKPERSRSFFKFRFHDASRESDPDVPDDLPGQI
jgi:hypothetical protein